MALRPNHVLAQAQVRQGCRISRGELRWRKAGPIVLFPSPGVDMLGLLNKIHERGFRVKRPPPPAPLTA